MEDEEESTQSSTIVWDRVSELTKMAHEKGADPSLWAIEVSSILCSYGVSFPSVELANVLVSHACWDNNVPLAWKILDKALCLKIVHPFLVLGQLSTRVIPNRHSSPAAFRLYMELLKSHAFTLQNYSKLPNHEKAMNSLDKVLGLSQTFELKAPEAGALFILFVFSIVWQLLDVVLDDEGLFQLTDINPKWPVKSDEMEIDIRNMDGEKKLQHKENLKSANTIMAINLIGIFLQNKVTCRILYLARRNMLIHWKSFMLRLQLLVKSSQAIRSSESVTQMDLTQFLLESDKVMSGQFHGILLQESMPRIKSRHVANSDSFCLGISRSALWLPLDMLLEDTMDSGQISATSAIETITRLVKSLKAISAVPWHEIFLGLWMAALRLVQRERDPIEGPVAPLDARLSMLLSITPLVIADLVEEEETAVSGGLEYDLESKEHGKRRRDLLSSLQNLIDHKRLLTPPQSVEVFANRAATKATMVVSGISDVNTVDTSFNCSGSLLHLIVEACIARYILDTSFYFWKGYVNERVDQLPSKVPSQALDWSSFMKGANLSPEMLTALVSTPASSLAEIEKVFEIALQGSYDEKVAAASILCGASFTHGWNIQEHTVFFITRLLSPPVPVDYSESESYLVSYAPMLNVLLVGIAPADSIQIFSLHGLVPELACSLMTICEVFGSCVPNTSWTMPTGEEITAHAVFSNAFILLLRLWRFNQPPFECRVGDVPPVSSQLTPEYLLLVRNSHLASSVESMKDPNRRRLAKAARSSTSEPIFVDSFPKLKLWYRQHRACIASPLAALVSGSPVQKTMDLLLNMMFRNISRGDQSLTNITSGSSSSSSSSSTSNGNQDVYLRPKLPAWDILEAVPFVAEAALTACAHGVLSPRGLCTGLKDLVDYLPATLASFVGYFSAEVTRGVWKTVSMNGTDWPSPATNLSNVEEQMKNILAATGVDVPSLALGINSTASLPLPLAAFVSLTITYRLDKSSIRFLDLAGPALESLANGCPWPCMPIVASLWTLKARRWSEFLFFSASRSVFLQSNDAIVQLLKSCFSSTIASSSGWYDISSTCGGVGPLLGHGFRSLCTGELSPVAPGIVYLRVYRFFKDIMFLRNVIVSLLMQTVQDIACGGLGPNNNPKNRTKHGNVSIAEALTKVKIAASFGASVISLTGGSSLAQSLIRETLPSWFTCSSVHQTEQEKDHRRGVMLPTLRGYALAYLAAYCGVFIWGVDSSSLGLKRRREVLACHMKFMASALEGKMALGCDRVTWHTYTSFFLRFMVRHNANWIKEMDVELLKRLSEGLRLCNEKELALALLEVGGVRTMSAAADLIVQDTV